MAVTWKKIAYEDNVIAKNLLTEQGDIIYASGVATPAALVHGNVGDSLQSGGHGANPSWSAGFKKLASDPVSPGEGETWYNTTDHHYKGYNGTEVILIG